MERQKRNVYWEWDREHPLEATWAIRVTYNARLGRYFVVEWTLDGDASFNEDGELDEDGYWWSREEYVFFSVSKGKPHEEVIPGPHPNFEKVAVVVANSLAYERCNHVRSSQQNGDIPLWRESWVRKSFGKNPPQISMDPFSGQEIWIVDGGEVWEARAAERGAKVVFRRGR